jgi:protein-tyrosine phosphatase
MQIEFDDTQIAKPYGIQVFWNAVDDDFQPKPPHVFQDAVAFGLKALEDPNAKIFIHCAAGVHRAPMMTLALLRALGFELKEAMHMIQSKRHVVDFADVYVKSVERFIAQYQPAEP